MRLGAVPAYVNSYLSRGPSYVILYVTSRCNQKCVFCFYADSLNKPWGDGLTLDEITKIARSLKHCIHMTLTGGEPFVRRDLLDVIRTLIEHGGVRNFTIPSNGSMPDRVTAGMHEICAEYPRVEFRIALSIDALGEKHDEIRVYPNAFKKAERTFHAVKTLQTEHPNLHLIVTTVASKYNKEHLKEFLDYSAENLQCDDHTVMLARGNPKEPDAKDVSPEEYNGFVQYLAEKQQRRTSNRRLHKGILHFVEKETRYLVNRTVREDRYQIPCVAGDKFLVIYDTGDVYPCEILETMEKPPEVLERFGGNFRIGNVRDHDYDVMSMLRSDRGRDLVRFILDSKCYCTFECAIAASIVFNPRTLVRTALSPPSRSGSGSP